MHEVFLAPLFLVQKQITMCPVHVHDQKFTSSSLNSIGYVSLTSATVAYSFTMSARLSGNVLVILSITALLFILLEFRVLYNYMNSLNLSMLVSSSSTLLVGRKYITPQWFLDFFVKTVDSFGFIFINWRFFDTRGWSLSILFLQFRNLFAMRVLQSSYEKLLT